MPSTYTQKATERKAAKGVSVGHGLSSSVKELLCSTVELAATTAAGATVKFGKIPSNARISGLSRVYWDDLSSLSATLALGFGAVNANITDDDDCLSDAHDLGTATSAGASVVADKANVGKAAWEFVSGQTSDPGGELEVYGTVEGAANTIAGTLSVELLGYVD
jgi:hypothetical protein